MSMKFIRKGEVAKKTRKEKGFIEFTKEAADSEP